jgi:ribosomal protein S18 acetylase RimI-like enzyme
MRQGELMVSVEGIVTSRYDADVPRQWEERLWELYLASFGNLDTFQDQMCYNREAFIMALRDSDYVKFVIHERDMPLGIALATNDMHKAGVAYINVEYLRKRYPSHISTGTFYYVTSIFVAPECHRMGYVKSLLYAMLSYMREEGRLAGFDFCEAKEFLAGLIEELSRDRAVDIPVKAKRMDAQVYYVLELEETHGIGNEVDLAEVREFSRAKP